MREQERRKLIRGELDKQLREKKERASRELDERRAYESLQTEHVMLLGQREQEKANQHREKITQEKESRDRQLNDEKKRRRRDDK